MKPILRPLICSTKYMSGQICCSSTSSRRLGPFLVLRPFLVRGLNKSDLTTGDFSPISSFNAVIISRCCLLIADLRRQLSPSLQNLICSSSRMAFSVVNAFFSSCSFRRLLLTSINVHELLPNFVPRVNSDILFCPW